MESNLGCTNYLLYFVIIPLFIKFSKCRNTNFICSCSAGYNFCVTGYSSNLISLNLNYWGDNVN